MVDFTLFAIFFFASIFFLLVLVIGWIIFGRLIRLQLKRWILAGKGYVEVEHISATKVRNYFIMRPNNQKFDIGEGFYHYIPECITKKGALIRKFDQNFLSKVPEVDISELEGLTEKEQEEFKARNIAEWTELKGLYAVIKGMKYDPELLNRKSGMPVITYYGDNPDPINPADRKKVYGSGVIKDMYLRLLLTQRYKDFQLIIVVALISFVVIAIALVGMWNLHSTDANSIKNCLSQLNTSNTAMLEFANKTLQQTLQSSTVILGGAK